MICEGVIKMRIIFFLQLLLLTSSINLQNNAPFEQRQYQKRFESINTMTEAKEAGYEQVGFITGYFADAGIKDECTVYAAINRHYGRVALFFTNADEKVLHKTENLECNNFFIGLHQPNADIAAISARDINGDGLDEILIISLCLNEGARFKIGDIIFQNASAFYRDWRISDKINRFDMNKDIEMMTSFVRDGHSAEFLYSAATLEELINGGFQPLADQSFETDFEKFGAVEVVPGFYSMGWQHIFIMYLVNGDGQVVWNFQCMRGYDNFSRMTGISFKDVDGDGWADLSVLIEYMSPDDDNRSYATNDFSIYYQRDGYFFEDKDFHKAFCKDMTGEEAMSDIVRAAQEFWGWQAG